MNENRLGSLGKGTMALWAIAVALIVAAPTMAAGYSLSMSGTMGTVRTGTSVVYSETNTTNATTCWIVGDTFTFTDTETTDNTNGAGPVIVAYKLELYQWIAGTPGNQIQLQQINHNVAQGDQLQTSLQVTGTYTGWNGAPPASCQLSFHVYRHWGVNTPNGALDSAFY